MYTKFGRENTPDPDVTTCHIPPTEFLDSSCELSDTSTPELWLPNGAYVTSFGHAPWYVAFGYERGMEFTEADLRALAEFAGYKLVPISEQEVTT